MANETPVYHEDHYIDSSSSSAGIWAAVVVLIVLLAILLFGSRLFNRGSSPDSGTNINGRVNIPSGGGTDTGGTGGTGGNGQY